MKNKTPAPIQSWITRRVGTRVKYLLLSITQAHRREHAVILIQEPVVVWKWIYERVMIKDRDGWGYHNYRRRVVPLRLPKGAEVVVHQVESKCRTDIAKYLGDFAGISGYDGNFKYHRGRYVRSYLSRPEETCGRGIHFCFRKKEVADY